MNFYRLSLRAGSWIFMLKYTDSLLKGSFVLLCAALVGQIVSRFFVQHYLNRVKESTVLMASES